MSIETCLCKVLMGISKDSYFLNSMPLLIRIFPFVFEVIDCVYLSALQLYIVFLACNCDTSKVWVGNFLQNEFFSKPHINSTRLCNIYYCAFNGELCNIMTFLAFK